MWRGVSRNVLLGPLVFAATLALVPAAWASITPTATLNQSAGTAAGGTHNLGVDLKFAPAGGDSPDHLTLNLPPGLLANASVDGGACLQTADLTDSACQVGSGTVTADAYGTIPVPTAVTFDLVPPPGPGDLAGLAVNSNGTQIGSTADVRVRPSGDPAGVGVTIAFVLPNALYGVPISITEINSTFDGLRYPATCPSTPQSFSIAVNSYNDATVHTAAAPLSVTGCSSLPFSPSFAVVATRDSTDKQVKLTTDITQSAAESPSRSVALGLPVAVLPPNVAAVKLLCPNLASGTCTPVGSATAISPLYPKALTGEAYLTGSFTGLSLTLIFPSPFPLTLTGSVDLTSNTTTFTGLPDIPLTDLAVTLNSGNYGLFEATCGTPSGTATAALTDQNGDKSAKVAAKFTVAGCSSSTGGSGSTTRPQLSNAGSSGLRTGHVSLRFRVSAARRGAKVAAVTVELPAGLRFVGRGGRVSGVSVSGARIRSLSISHGHLVIVVRRAVSSMRVTVKSAALAESAALRARARAGKLKSLPLTVVVRDAKGKRTTIRVRVTNLGL
ncbi:MAG TPA: hypothetical protein VG371_01175 [Solirubrobacteraceae bacterium]|nr:hypothetical protein [Solirubrobacteraceae bacterium]